MKVQLRFNFNLDEYTDAYIQGCNAAKKGLVFTDNPYPIYTWMYAEWYDGFIYTQKTITTFKKKKKRQSISG